LLIYGLYAGGVTTNVDRWPARAGWMKTILLRLQANHLAMQPNNQNYDYGKNKVSQDDAFHIRDAKLSIRLLYIFSA
jgi:hypothetical protein